MTDGGLSKCAPAYKEKTMSHIPAPCTLDSSTPLQDATPSSPQARAPKRSRTRSLSRAQPLRRSPRLRRTGAPPPSPQLAASSTVIFELRAALNADADLCIQLEDFHRPLETQLLKARSLTDWHIISYVQEERGDELVWTIVARHDAPSAHNSASRPQRPRADNLFRVFARMLVATLSSTLELEPATLENVLQRRTWIPVPPYLRVWADARFATVPAPPSSQLPLFDVEVISALGAAVASTLASSADSSDGVLHSCRRKPLGPLLDA